MGQKSFSASVVHWVSCGQIKECSKTSKKIIAQLSLIDIHYSMHVCIDQHVSSRISTNIIMDLIYVHAQCMAPS